MTLALTCGRTRERLTDRDWPESETSARPGLSATLSQQERQHQIRCPGVDLLVTAGNDVPAWVLPTVQALAWLTCLPDNWDSYGASPIEPAYIPAVLRFLSGIMRPGTALPAVVPTSRGGVQLEWHAHGVDLEIEFTSPSRVRGFFEDRAANQQWDEDLTFDLSPLADAVEKLSQPR